ncbi:MAG: hypothetical protein N3A69_01980 [Leptospiraceae bacterium]|nr:hypothetical protein [Leptospiraceae bacterium]
MTYLKPFYLYYLFLILLNLPVFSNPISYGWETYGNYSTLYLKGKKFFQTNEPFSISTEPSKENLESFLFLGEYYISKLDKENFFKLVTQIQQIEVNSFLENFLLFLWYQENAREKEGEKKLTYFVNNVTDVYEKKLAEKILLFLIRKQNQKITVTYDDIKNLSCSRSKNYYNICRVLKLRTLLELIQLGSSSHTTEYANLDRMIAPFFEEEELAYIPFLDKLIPDLPPKLSALGLTAEASHFQKILITNESLVGKFDINSYEKLASYQIFAGKFDDAERSLEIALKNLRSVTVMRNNLLLKLGMLNYLKKDYNKALSYLIQLDFKYWGKTIRNPLTDEPFSVNSARELIALVLSKAKSGALAVKALNELKKNFPTEEGLFVRLRIAQILFKDKPQLAEKMTDEIIYIAQSKGWKRVEYAATLLNGFINIVNKKQRKAVIQFTKSYGILGNSDPGFTSEWIRQSGMIRARISGRERGNYSSTLKKLILQAKDSHLNTEFLEFKLYLDPRFGVEEFKKLAINYFISNKDYDSLLEVLLLSKSEPNNNFYEKGNLQIPKVHRLIKSYYGFKASIDNVYYKGVWGKYREQHVSYLRKMNDGYNLSLLKNVSIPVLFLLPYEDKIYSVGYDPDNNKTKWTINSFPIKEYQTANYYNKLLSLYPFLVRDMSYQLFFNPMGLDLHQILQRQKVGGFGYLFFSLQRDSAITRTQPVHLECNPQISSSLPLSIEQFEGSKTNEHSATTQIWNFYEVSSKTLPNPQETYQWKCKNGETLEFRKLLRRMDSLTLPNSLYLSNPLLHNTNPYFSNEELFLFLDFWFRKGISQVVYTTKIENDVISETVLKLIMNPSTLPDEWKKVQVLWKNSDNEGIILWREPK